MTHFLAFGTWGNLFLATGKYLKLSFIAIAIAIAINHIPLLSQ